MFRFSTLAATILLATQTAVSAGPITGVTVAGQLNGGTKVTAEVAISSSGAVSGTGALYGTNPSNGYNYRYPFTVTGLRSAPGNVVLTGKFDGLNAPFTLTAAVPSGAQKFTYRINGTTATYVGTGSVTVK